MPRHRRRIHWIGFIAIALLAASCSADGGGSNGAGSGDGSKADTVVLVTYDSFALPKDAAAEFERRTGAKIRVIAAGDSGTMLTKALISAGSPEGDVIFGIDDTLATRALSVDLLDKYRPSDGDRVEDRLRLTGNAGDHLTPIDHGDVCLNLDSSWFAKENLTPPKTLEDLTDPAYRDLVVLSSPVTSSPGLAFLIGTVAEFGENGWKDYWSRLKANGLAVRPSWDDAYYSDYTVSGGDRPIVLSYASSPPAEVVFSEGKRTEPVSEVMVDTCVSQTEYAGVLNGAKHPELARKLIDFMLSDEWQSALPLTNFVFPAVDVALPKEFVLWAPTISDPLTLDPDTINSKRDDWIEQWRQILE